MWPWWSGPVGTSEGMGAIALSTCGVPHVRHPFANAPLEGIVMQGLQGFRHGGLGDVEEANFALHSSIQTEGNGDPPAESAVQRAMPSRETTLMCSPARH